MNPPFERGSDIRHIEHALTFLKPGGRLVAICANGPRQRERLQPMASEWIDLPAGSFKRLASSNHTRPAVLGNQLGDCCEPMRAASTHQIHS